MGVETSAEGQVAPSTSRNSGSLESARKRSFACCALTAQLWLVAGKAGPTVGPEVLKEWIGGCLGRPAVKGCDHAARIRVDFELRDHLRRRLCRRRLLGKQLAHALLVRDLTGQGRRAVHICGLGGSHTG
jgi:hypothetical protein